MKIIKSFYGDTFFELCITGYHTQSYSLAYLNRDAKKLSTDARRICKAVGIHDEFSDYSVDICFPEEFIFISIHCPDEETGKKIIAEARKRHYKKAK